MSHPVHPARPALVSLLFVSLAQLQSCATLASPGPDLVPVSSDPPGADVYLDGRLVGATPIDVRVHRESEGVFTLAKDGYYDAHVDRDKVLNGWFFPGALGWFFLWPVIPVSMATDLAAGNQGKYSTEPLHIVLEPEPAPPLAPPEELPSSSARILDAPVEQVVEEPAEPLPEILDLSATAAVAAPMQLSDVFAQVFASTFAIESATASAAAVMISPDGYALTAAEPVVDGGDFTARFRDGKSAVVEVVRVDEDRDVALLKMHLRDQSFLRFRAGPVPAIGTEVYTVGAPENVDSEGTTTRGIISGFGVLAGASFFQTDAASGPLHHGGPVFTSTGQVIGVVSARMAGASGEGLSYCVPTSEIEKTLRVVLPK